MDTADRISLQNHTGDPKAIDIWYQRTSHTSNRAHGKITERQTLFGLYPPKITVWSRSGVDVIGNLSGLKAVVFLWRFGPLLCDARAICSTRSPRVTSLSSLYGTNDIVEIREPQTRLKRTQLRSDCTEKTRTTVRRGK